MGVGSSAREHVVAFSWWVGCPDVAQAEAELRDLALLHDAVEERRSPPTPVRWSSTRACRGPRWPRR